MTGNLPKTIETEMGDILNILDIVGDKFVIEGSPTIVSCKIELDEFQRLNDNGLEMPFGMKAKNPEYYQEWYEKYKEEKPGN